MRGCSNVHKLCITSQNNPCVDSGQTIEYMYSVVDGVPTLCILVKAVC